MSGDGCRNGSFSLARHGQWRATLPFLTLLTLICVVCADSTSRRLTRHSAHLPHCRARKTACVPTSTRTSARDTYPSDSMLPTCLATIPCRTLWNIISLTTPSLSLLANSDTRATPSCSVSARSATATTTQKRAVRCVPSTWTDRSSLPSILRLAPTSRTVPASTKARHGTTHSTCPMT